MDQIKSRVKKCLIKYFKEKHKCNVEIVEKDEGFYVNHSCADLRDLGMTKYHYAKTWNDGNPDTFFFPIKMSYRHE